MRPERPEPSATATGGDPVRPGPAAGLDFILSSINEESIERRRRVAGPPRPARQGLSRALVLRPCRVPGRQGCVSEGVRGHRMWSDPVADKPQAESLVEWDRAGCRVCVLPKPHASFPCVPCFRDKPGAFSDSQQSPCPCQSWARPRGRPRGGWAGQALLPVCHVLHLFLNVHFTVKD